MKNTIKTISFCLYSFILTMPSLHAETYGDTTYNHQITSVVEIDSDQTISIYNTGMAFNFENPSGFSGDLRTAVDGKINVINSKDFDLGKFIKQIDINYAVDTENAVLMLSVGKMPTGAKTDLSNPSKVGGVMGIRLSIEPQKIPLIQKWLDANQLKINRIDITRYDSSSADRVDLKDLNKSNMTSFAFYLSKNNNIQTFFIYKTPDSDNPFGVTSKSLGVVYMMGGKLDPQFFAMKHQSDADFMNLDLLVLSASVEALPNIRSALTYSHAKELLSGVDIESYDLSLTKEIRKTKDYSLTTSFGVKVDRGTTDDQIIYFRLESKF